MRDEIVEYSLYPDPEVPEWGCLYIHTEVFGGDLGRRATMRGDVGVVRSFDAGFSDEALVRDPGTLGGVWQMAPGWPDDWGYDGFVDEEIWSEPFTFDPEGRPVILE